MSKISFLIGYSQKKEFACTSVLLPPRIQSVKTLASFPKLFLLQPQQHSLLLFYCSFKIFISVFEESYSGLGVWHYQKKVLFAQLDYFLDMQKARVLSRTRFKCLYRFLLSAVKTHPEMKLTSVKVNCVILARIRLFTF